MADMMDLVYEVFSSLPRGGPGSPETTRRALGLLGPLPQGKPVLDVGCGTGSATLELARAGLSPVSSDISPLTLRILRERLRDGGLGDSPGLVAADMTALPFAREAFGLIWCEAAVYTAGSLENGLRAFLPHLAPGGFMAVSEAVWTTSEPSGEAKEFWAEYPAMLALDEARLVIRDQGLELVGDFLLPDSDWEDHFYAHLERALPEFLERHPGDDQAVELATSLRHEIDVRRRHANEYGYVYFIMRKG